MCFNEVLLTIVVGIIINSDNNIDVAPPGSNVTFNCTNFEHDERSVIVVYEGHRYDTRLLDNVNFLMTFGIFVKKFDDVIILIVLATEESNGTMVQCRDFTFGLPVVFSELLTLKVIGNLTSSDITQVAINFL